MSARSVQQWFAADGPLARHVEGFAPREAQSQMAARVSDTLDAAGQLLVEAPTGTGKTLAYLLPLVNSGYKAIVATATRHLQDQIFSKDLPLALSACESRPRISLLKGRANYLCLYRLDTAESSAGLDARLHGQLRRVREWAATTRTGDISEIGDPAEPSPLWPRVTSTVENCLGQDCPFYDDCWVLMARREAQAADIVVANHHLFFADLALREEGFGEVLPGADAIVLDEAHKLPDLAGRFFGMTVSARQLKDLARDGLTELDAAGGDMPALAEAFQVIADAQRALDTALPSGGGHFPWDALTQSAGAADALADARQAVAQAIELGRAAADRTEGLAAVMRRAAQTLERFDTLRDGVPDTVRWLEWRGAGWFLHQTPLDASAPFARAVEQGRRAWILTSATLSVDDRLDYFAERLGLPEAEQLLLQSPFDYARNSLLYLPPELPAPGAPQFDDRAVDAMWPLLDASDGGAFVLCTSYRAVSIWAQRLRERFGDRLLVQGSSGRADLLARFRADGNAVLVGTSSFWEGVDVRGPALRLVIIDRLPFASPSDPVLNARIEAIRDEGGSPFKSLQLPQAVIAFKQGVGRLIRDASDRGVLAVCDPRLRTKGYGRTFLKSLPPLPVTSILADATDFLKRLDEAP